VRATLDVRVSLDATGAPFAVRATQRLDVRKIGDYSFTIGAPIRSLATAAGSTADPGLRTGAYLWQGFNPGRRVLAATIELEQEAAEALPLRIDVAGGSVRLSNATAVRTAASAADGNPAELRSYLAALRTAALRGEPATGGGTSVTSTPRQVRMRISAPLAISGTIGTRRVQLTLGGSGHPENATFPAGAIRLTVRPQPPLELLDAPPGESGRALFARATRASLESARARQYDTFLGNPDPAGPSTATYLYVSAKRPPPVAAAVEPEPAGRDWTRLLGIVAAVLAAALVAAAAWARA
jgi:hypothetical protein